VKITNQESSEQRTDARARRDLDAANGKGHENANEAAEEDREPQHHEINAGAGPNDDTDPLARLLHDRFRTNDPKQIATLQDDTGPTGIS
jgi:hypothetical protein